MTTPGRTRNISVNQNFTTSNNPNTNAVLRFIFPSPQTMQRCELALNHLDLFFSWFNITAVYGNNSFSYLWPNGGSFSSFNVTVPDGSYEIKTLNTFLQQEMLANKTYLVNSEGANVFFLNLQANNTFYRTALTSTALPTTLPSGWSNPGTFTLPSTPQCPCISIPSPGSSLSSMSQFLGFNPAVYPPLGSSATTTLFGQNVPVLDQVTSVNVLCESVNQGLVNRFPNLIYTFSPTVAFGSQIQVDPQQQVWYPVVDSIYASITLRLVDQNGSPIILQDPVWSAMLLVRQF
jgi:hypothetical protein